MRILAILTALLLAAPAWADHGAPRDTRPLSQTWIIFDSDCVDLYDTDGEGEAPEGGAVDLTTLANWDTLAEAYRLQANHEDHTQVSGSPDGLCDAAPNSIKGSWTTAGATNLYIGPVNMPHQGFYYGAQWTGKGAEVATLTVGAPIPWATDLFPVATTGSQPSSASFYLFGTPYQPTSDDVDTSNALPLPVDTIYLRFEFDSAATWTADAAISPVNPRSFGR